MNCINFDISNDDFGSIRVHIFVSSDRYISYLCLDMGHLCLQTRSALVDSLPEDVSLKHLDHPILPVWVKAPAALRTIGITDFDITTHFAN
jgi:hypothetical protein